MEIDTIHSRGFFSIVKQQSYGTVVLSVMRDCYWKLMIDEHNIFPADNTLLPFIGETAVLAFKDTALRLNTADKVIQLLSKIDRHTNLCIGNPDNKFDTVRRRRKGIFKSRNGTVIGCTF